MTSAPVLQAVDLWRIYPSGEGEVAAVAGVSLQADAGEFVALMGRSGSGKTTLLNLLGGLDRPTRGVVRIDGVDLRTLNDRQITKLRRASLGFIFQSYGLIPTLSALENVDLPLHLMGWPWRRRQQRARETLERVGMAERAAHRVYELSGGEQQRVAVARALAGEPQLILADEPTGSLDSTTGASLWQLLAEVVETSRLAVVAATHDLSVREYAHRAVVMQDGQLDEVPSTPE